MKRLFFSIFFIHFSSFYHLNIKYCIFLYIHIFTKSYIIIISRTNMPNNKTQKKSIWKKYCLTKRQKKEQVHNIIHIFDKKVLMNKPYYRVLCCHRGY